MAATLRRAAWSAVLMWLALAGDGLAAEDGDYIAVQQGRADVVRLYPRLEGNNEASETPGFETKMVNAQPINDDQLPGVVRIEYVENGTPSICTGILIARLEVLTAGHCSCGDPGSYIVRFRWINPRSRTANPSRKVSILGAPIRYARYSCDLPLIDQPGRDLAMLHLDPVSVDDAFTREAFASIEPTAPTSMANVYRDRTVVRLFVVGYGLTETGDVPEDQKRIAFIRPVSYFCSTGRVAASPCEPFREFALSNVIPDPSAVASDSCLGDSGGPVLWFTSLPGVFPQTAHLVGITSRGIDGVTGFGGRECGGGGIYTNVGHSDVMAWIAAQHRP